MTGSTTASALLHDLRASSALSQQRLAALSAVSVRTIRGLETGSIKEPRRSTLLALAGPLGLNGNALTAFMRAWNAVDLGPLTLADMLERGHVAGELLEDINVQPQRLRDITKICDTVIDENGLLAKVTLNRTVEALEDGIERVVWIQNICPDTMIAERIVTGDALNCRPGRSARLSDTVIAHELLLDATLDRGDTVMISFSSDFRDAYRPGSTPARETESLTGIPVGATVHIEQVRFTPPRLPAAVWQVFQRSLPSTEPPRRMLSLSPFAVAQIVIERPQPGAHGIRWTWDGDQPQ